MLGGGGFQPLPSQSVTIPYTGQSSTIPYARVTTSQTNQPSLSVEPKEGSSPKHREVGKLVGNIAQDYAGEHRKLSVLVWPPLANSRMLYHKRYCCCIPGWFLVWALPMFLAGCGFLLQNFQLHIGTYRYVHQMLQYDLKRTETIKALNVTAEHIPLTFGLTPEEVAFGSLDDPMTSSLGEYKRADLTVLDALAALFPFLFVLMTVAMDKPYVWTRIMLSFFILAVGKGLFSWITVVPDSNGWQACKARLAKGSTTVEWYAEERSILELLLVDPKSRKCADMMWSGHTYFVTLFAFGLHECVRRGMMTYLAYQRVLVESLVALTAILQQVIEIYLVLKSRFHYASDVVMAVFLTYLLYTNSSIAVVASWWTTPTLTEDEGILDYLHKEKGLHFSSKWFRNGMAGRGDISLGCCCCAWSRQWIYSPADVRNILCDIEEATSNLKEHDPLKMDLATRQLLMDGMGMLALQSMCDPDGWKQRGHALIMRGLEDSDSGSEE